MPIRIPTWLRPRPEAAPPPAALEAFPSATNAARPVIELMRPHLATGEALIVTGYQDFLAALAILLDEVPGLERPGDGPPPRIRLVFGVDTAAAERIGGGADPGEVARRDLLARRGLRVEDAADLRAVLAIDAIEAGRLDLRVFDPLRARETLGVRGDRRLHAKMVVSPRGAAQGSANFSRAGLYANIEYVDAFPVPTGPSDALVGRAAIDRTENAELIWEAGRDWNEAALEILRALLRPVTAEDAVARTVLGQAGFAPWRPQGRGRALLPYQRDLVYEASAAVYEHGFALVEAPAGAGKTDIGRALARTLADTHRRCGVGGAGEDRPEGTLLLAPARVLGNWRREAPPGMQARSIDAFARGQKATDGQLGETPVEAFAALLIDESHAVTSGGEAPSARAEAVGLAPPVWTVGLSATLLGNRDLDWLAHLQERRASLWMGPRWLEAIERLFDADRDRRMLMGEGGEGTPLTEAAREELADLLAPFVALRTRGCVGERDATGQLRFPQFEVHPRSPRLDGDALRKASDAVADRLDRLAGGERRAQRQSSRLGTEVVRPMGERSLLARTLMNLLRASTELAVWEMRYGSLGQRLRKVERGRPRRDVPGQLSLWDELPDAPTPICDEIERLLDGATLRRADRIRCDALREIEARHDRVVVLAERVGTLRMMSQAMRAAGSDRTAFLCASAKEDADVAGSTDVYVPVRGGDKLEARFRPGGTAPPRATAYLTYAMAEGINLQSADALVLLGVTSNLTHLVQGMGRIDRIDSPHDRVHYYPLDLPTRALASDEKVRDRLLRRDRLAGTTAQSGPGAAVLSRVETSLRAARAPRDGNPHDVLGAVRDTLDPERLAEIEAAAPEGLWGARLALLAPGSATLLHLRGEAGTGRFAPPRLLAIRTDGTVEREQAVCARLLRDAWKATRDAGLHDRPPDQGALGRALTHLVPAIAQLRPWDIRPERLVGPLRAVETLLGEETCRQLTVLPLRDLEEVSQILIRGLAPFWHVEKKRVAQSFLDGAPYLVLSDVLTRLEADSDARNALTGSLAACLARLTADPQPEFPPERIAVAFVPVS